MFSPAKVSHISRKNNEIRRTQERSHAAKLCRLSMYICDAYNRHALPPANLCAKRIGSVSLYVVQHFNV